MFYRAVCLSLLQVLIHLHSSAMAYSFCMSATHFFHISSESRAVHYNLPSHIPPSEALHVHGPLSQTEHVCIPLVIDNVSKRPSAYRILIFWAWHDEIFRPAKQLSNDAVVVRAVPLFFMSSHWLFSILYNFCVVLDIVTERDPLKLNCGT